MNYNHDSRGRGHGRGRFGGMTAGPDARAHRDDRGHEHGIDHVIDHLHRGPGGRGGGRGGRGGRRGPRARRGDLRLSVLYLLAERPMHGYELMSEISERTGGVWQPSPGSVYPTLSMLEDEGLITAESEGSRRTFTLTDEGRKVAPGSEDPSPWAELRTTLRSVRVAVEQVVEAGSQEDRTRMQALLVELRRELYLLLAGQGDRPAPDA
jgi:DNA-binding PadR family transcriptional regulator